MQKFSNSKPTRVIFLIGIIYFFLIFFNPAKGVQFGDFGLMYIQVEDIVKSGYSTFAVHYKGEKVDSEYKFFPFKKPFLGKVGEKYYIDFPPYFPLLNAPFYQWLGVNGLYLLNYFSLLLTLFLLYKLGKLFELENSFINLSLFLYSFGMTATTYNLVFHEYPLAIFWITAGFYFASVYFKKERNYSLILFGFFGAVSLYFRLEMVFVILACGLGLVFVYPKNFLKIGIYSLLGFIFPFVYLLYLNFDIHGHPLGLRFALTLTDESTVGLLGRIAIIRDMLFSNTRGFFPQSPFVFVLLIGFYFVKEKLKKEKYLFIILIIGFVLVLLTSPNHGDHRAPRYLFGLYPVFCLASVFVISQVQNFFKEDNDSKEYLWKVIQSIFSILILASFYSSFQNYQWMQRAAKNVEMFNSELKKISDKDTPIIFRDYAQPLNTQVLYTEQMLFVVEELVGIKKLLLKLSEHGTKRVIISQLFPTELGKEKRPEIEDEYKKQFQLIAKDANFYFPDSPMHLQFHWIDLGKKQNFLILNIFLQ